MQLSRRVKAMQASPVRKLVPYSIQAEKQVKRYTTLILVSLISKLLMSLWMLSELMTKRLSPTL